LSSERAVELYVAPSLRAALGGEVVGFRNGLLLIGLAIRLSGGGAVDAHKLSSGESLSQQLSGGVIVAEGMKDSGLRCEGGSEVGGN
jgi:hypothetical protein